VAYARGRTGFVILRPHDKAGPLVENEALRLKRCTGWLRAHWQVLPVAVLGIVTAFFRLGARGLWGDEVWQVWWTDPRVFIRLRHPTDLPMQYLLVGVTTLFGESEFWIRLPSAVLASANVVVAFLLGRRVFNTTTGWTAALLLAAAPYHVWYAQEAHQYAALSFYSALSVYLLYALLARPTPANATAFAVVTVVNLATHFCAFFSWLAEVVIVTSWTAVRWWREPSWRQDKRAALWPLLVVVASGLGPAFIAAPLVLSAAYYTLVQGYTFNPDIPRAQITLPFIVDIFSRLGSGTGAPNVVFGLSALGGVLASVYFRRWLPLTLFATWLALPFATVAVLRPRAFLIPRYFLFLQPIYLLLVAWGLAQLPRLFAGATRSLASSVRARWAARVTACLLAGAVVLEEVPVTWNGYWVERLNDWSAMCRYLRRHVQPGDMIVGQSYVEGTLTWCYRKVRGVTVVAATKYSLSELASRGQNVWYLALNPRAPDGSQLNDTLAEIPRGEWAPKGLLAPDFDNAGRLRYPQHERPVTLFFRAAREAPARLVFRDNIVKRDAPPYMEIRPDDYRVFRLGLSAIQARILRIEYWDLPGVSLHLAIDGTPSARIDSMRTASWAVREIVLPADLPDVFTLEMTNRGSRAAAVSRLEVSYLATRSMVPRCPDERGQMPLCRTVLQCSAPPPSTERLLGPPYDMPRTQRGMLADRDERLS